MKDVSLHIRGVWIILLAGLLSYPAVAQSTVEESIPVQTIRGTVSNARTKQPIAGVTVQIVELKRGSVSRPNGEFRLENIPVGRHLVRISGVGYEPTAQTVVLTSGKQEVLQILLTERVVQMEDVMVSGSGAFTPVNEAALISSTIFSVDDVERYAGSRNDPARMAQNFAGVLGANDTRNDIIIRGGSPTELLWRLDGLDIPNPNHFATQGATGGPISVINSNLLTNSDFLTGAYPAEYGDKMSGVFDLRTRKGNSEKYEFLGQFGFNGLEAMAEGPIGEKASFIANYRYSFLDLLETIGVDFGFAGIPRYQDGTFKFDWSPSEKDEISLTTVFGLSDIFIRESVNDSVSTGEFDIKNGTDLITVGLTWRRLLSETTYQKLLIGTVYSRFRTDLDSITVSSPGVVASLTPWFEGRSTEGYYTARYTLYHAPNPQLFLYGGVETRLRYYNINDRRTTSTNAGEPPFVSEADGTALQLLSFVNVQYRFTENFTANAGIHSQYLQINDQITLEPRLSLEYKVAPGHSISAGTGIYRQSLPLTIYYSDDVNTSLDFMQSIHYVGGYSATLADDILLKVEGYYKDISLAPVDASAVNGISFLNAGTNFGAVSFDGPLSSEGNGRAYGAELTFMKRFSRGYYITATGSLVRQEYRGSDRVWRNGAFDNRFIVNLLAGYEWIIAPDFAIEFSGRYTHAGGAPVSPVDLVESRRINRTVFDNTNPFSLRNPDYARFDLRVDFRQNFDSFSIISFISIENLFNRENVFAPIYNSRVDEVRNATQLGFFPIGGIRVTW